MIEPETLKLQREIEPHLESFDKNVLKTLCAALLAQAHPEKINYKHLLVELKEAMLKENLYEHD